MRPKATVEICSNSMMDPESKIMHISKDLQQKQLFSKTAHRAGEISDLAVRPDQEGAY